jgi:hypothetical protein
MVSKISWPLTKGRYISQVHIDCRVSSYGTCSIFTHVRVSKSTILYDMLWVLIFMEPNKMFLAFFHGLKHAQWYNVHLSLLSSSYSPIHFVLYTTLHNFCYLNYQIVFCFKCPSGTFSNIFLLMVIYIMVSFILQIEYKSKTIFFSWPQRYLYDIYVCYLLLFFPIFHHKTCQS